MREFRAFDLPPVENLDTSELALDGAPDPQIGSVLASYSSLRKDARTLDFVDHLDGRVMRLPDPSSLEQVSRTALGALAGFVVVAGALAAKTSISGQAAMLIGLPFGVAGFGAMRWLARPAPKRPIGDGIYIGERGYTAFESTPAGLTTRTVLYRDCHYLLTNAFVQETRIKYASGVAGLAVSLIEEVTLLDAKFEQIDVLSGSTRKDKPPTAIANVVRLVSERVHAQLVSTNNEQLGRGDAVRFPCFKIDSSRRASATPDAITLQGDAIVLGGNSLSRSTVRYEVVAGQARFHGPNGVVAYPRNAIGNVEELERLLAYSGGP